MAEIVRHYREDEHSVEAARKVGSAIIDRVEVLQTFPDIGPHYPRKDGMYREVLCYDYSIFYRVEREARLVHIARIWHGRQNPESLDF